MQLQKQFMVASYVGRPIPVAIELYPGNQNDPQQYSDFIPQLMFLLKRNSLVVMDNGGAAATILDEITSRDNACLTRVRINESDIRAIEDHKDDMLFVGMDAACIMQTISSSQWTKYLFFSTESRMASVGTAEAAVLKTERERERAQRDLGKAPEKLVRAPKSPFYEIEVEKARFIITRDPWVDLDPMKELEDTISPKSGWFKPECSFPMDPRLALVAYRHRVEVMSTEGLKK